eukprot:07338.XXX_25634_23310_1 [CDS] Oithona nana genome sequencing.
MIFEIILGLLTLSLFILGYLKKYFVKHPKFPPGPKRLPFLGSLPFLPEDVKKAKKTIQTYMAETYGPISGLYIANRPMVVVSDYNMIKDLYKKLEACARPKISQPFHELRFGSSDGLQRGLLQSSGSEWMEQRRFTMRQLKDMGFGKSSMEDLIIREIEDLCALLRKDVGQEMSVNLKLNLSIVNALWVLLAGDRFELEDPKLQAIVSKFDDALRIQTGFQNVKDQILLKISPELFKKSSQRWHVIIDLFDDIKKLVADPIAAHKPQLDIDNPRDFIDVYLGHIQSQTDSNSSFYGSRGEESLICNLLDLFLAGAETTSSSLSWAFLFLLHHPEVQTRVQAEIDRVVGEGRNVSLEDKADLPYTNAVLMESMRMATIVPNALPHSASEDIEYNGYIIPKDAIISANLLHVHYDPKYWKNPEEFNPLRFYDETSNTFVPNERMVAFSIGKRYCLGQSLAEKEYFLFFSNILQKFTFDRSEETLPKIGRDSSISGGVIRPAPLYKTILKSR